jgi:hypothetical protein
LYLQAIFWCVLRNLFAAINVDISIEYTIDDGKGNKVHVNVRRFLYFF